MDLHYFLHGYTYTYGRLNAGFSFAKAIKLQNGKEGA